MFRFPAISIPAASVVLAAATVLVGHAAAAALAPSARPDAQPDPVATCDRLTAHPDDPRRTAKGVPWTQLDAAAAIQICRIAADAHPREPRLQFELGRALNKLAQYKEAADWYEKAAKAGYAAAETNLALLYSSGHGVPRDTGTARGWLRKAADSGYAPAQNAIAVMYMTGAGVPKNDAEAAKWLRLAVAQGYAAAIKNLGILYESGRGLPRNMYKAVELYEKAAAQGDGEGRARLAGAAFRIGLAFETGRPVTGTGSDSIGRIDYATAAEWYRRAAEAGSADAEFALGYLYEKGRGVPQDNVRAYAAYAVAERRGSDEIREAARLRRRALVMSMAPAEIFQARDIVTRAMRKHGDGYQVVRDTPEK